ncbi:hypothetical protein F443_13027, partial [Phytophthora nicotianae P1569]
FSYLVFISCRTEEFAREFCRSTLMHFRWKFDNHDTPIIEGEKSKWNPQSFAVSNILIECSNGDSLTNDVQIDFVVILIEITRNHFKLQRTHDAAVFEVVMLDDFC